VLPKLNKDFLILFIGLGVGVSLGLLLMLAINTDQANWWESWLQPAEPAPSVGRLAPDFTLTTSSGDSVQLSDYQGHPVVINFWATWCTPCRLEMPLLQDYHETYAPDLVILAVNLQEEDRAVNFFARELDLRFAILMDRDASVNQLYRVQGLPTTFFVDRDGRIRSMQIGSLSEKQLINHLQEIGISK
jgi:thiol-disulfide isomerase/thioredoxin